MSEIGRKLEVSIILTEPMLGTVPMDAEVYKKWIESRKSDRTEVPAAVANGQIPASEEDESATIEELEKKGWTGFHSDENGLFVYDYYVKGFLKHAGNVLKDQVHIKALRSKLDDFLFIFPRRIYLGDKKVPDGVLERPIRVMTQQGPRVSLIRSDYVGPGTKFNFQILLYPDHKEITNELLHILLGYGELMGFGQFRNGSYGRFTYVMK